MAQYCRTRAQQEAEARWRMRKVRDLIESLQALQREKHLKVQAFI